MSVELTISDDIIMSKILFIRGQKVMIDVDLAVLYNVENKNLKRQVRRNIERFPEDFMFELTKEEIEILRCQFGTSSWGGTRYVPMVFTEQGVAMLSSVLNSNKAIEMNIQIVRAFVLIRQFALSYRDLAEKLKELEGKYDQNFQNIYEAIDYLMKNDESEKKQKNRKQIGHK